jgi:hypothetical protein
MGPAPEEDGSELDRREGNELVRLDGSLLVLISLYSLCFPLLLRCPPIFAVAQSTDTTISGLVVDPSS